jgi:hypothetical protein
LNSIRFAIHLNRMMRMMINTQNPATPAGFCEQFTNTQNN